MFCCTCAGSCNHVGAHSYCDQHGGYTIEPRYVPPFDPPSFTITTGNPSLSDADVDRIARRVVELIELARLDRKSKKA